MTSAVSAFAAHAATPGLTTLAVVVTCGVTPYLPSALRAVACQTVVPGVVLVVDAASRANGLGDGTPVEEVVDTSGLDSVADVRIVRAPEAPTFIAAVRTGLERYAALLEQGNRRRAPRGLRATGTSWSTSSLATGQGLHYDTSSGRGQLTGPAGSLSPITRAESRAHAAVMDSTAAAQDSWLWLLHDDCAPEPECLERLLGAVSNARSVAMAGPKQVDWDHPDQLLEVGLRTTAAARRANDVIDGEIDQGQHDDRSDVLAVGTAGALVDRAAWASLSSVADDVSVFADGLTISRALRLEGRRVVVVPRAVLRHRRASYLGLRATGELGARAQAAPGSRPAGKDAALPADAEPQPDADSSFRARRMAQLRSWAAFSSRPLPALLLWFLVLGLGRGAWRLLTKDPALARDELAAAAATLRSARRLRRDRRRLGSRATVSRSVLAELYLPASEIRAVRRDRARQARERAARAAAPSELELRELAGLARRRRRVLGVVLLLTLALALVATSHVLTTRALTGGALASLDSGWRQLWDAAWSTWNQAGDGYAGTLSPFLAMLALPLAVASMLGISGDLAVHVLLVAALPLAAAGAWYAAGTITRRTSLRAWAALVWATTPTLLLALGQGRLAPLVVHLALPWAATALARAIGADRRDVILSGLVGARHVSEAERAELDRFASETVESLAHLGEDADREPDTDREPDAEVADAARAEDAAQAEDSGVLAADSEDSGGAQPGDDAAEPSPASQASPSPSHGPSNGPVDDDPATPVLDDAQGVLVSAQTTRGAAVRAAATEQYGNGSPTAAAVAGLLLSLVVAAAPATALVILPALVLLILVSPRRLARLALTVVPVAVTALPALWHAVRIVQELGGLAAWRQGLRYLLTDPGAPVAAPTPGGLELALGLPVSLEALTEGSVHAVVASMVLLLALAVLPVLALSGLLVSGVRGHRARAGVLMAVCGLVLAALAVRHVTAIGTAVDGTGSLLVTGWPGPGLSLMLAGLLTSALAGADAARATLVRHHFGWRHLTVAGLGCAALLAPLVLGVAWAAAVLSSSGTGSQALVMALRPASQQIPVIAAEMERSSAAGRVLVLTSTSEGMSVSLWRGDGTRLLDTTPDVLAAQLGARVAGATGALQAPLRPQARGGVAGTASTDGAAAADSALVPLTLSDRADQELADLVARAVGGQDEQVADELARHGVAVVLLTERAGDEVTASARAGLEATPGLESLAQTPVGVSWRVGPSQAAEVARLSLVDSTGQATTVSDEPGAQVTASEDERTLVLAERASQGWTASIGGTELEATSVSGSDWRQAFTVPAGVCGTLTLSHASPLAVAATCVIWVVWVLTALAALPLRRRRSLR